MKSIIIALCLTASATAQTPTLTYAPTPIVLEVRTNDSPTHAKLVSRILHQIRRVCGGANLQAKLVAQGRRIAERHTCIRSTTIYPLNADRAHALAQAQEKAQ